MRQPADSDGPASANTSSREAYRLKGMIVTRGPADFYQLTFWVFGRLGLKLWE